MDTDKIIEDAKAQAKEYYANNTAKTVKRKSMVLLTTAVIATLPVMTSGASSKIVVKRMKPEPIIEEPIPPTPVEEVEEQKQRPMQEVIAEYAVKAQAQMNHVAFDVISTFEGTSNGTIRERFGTRCSNEKEFSVGLWQCNKDTLNSILNSVFKKSPEEAKKIYGAQYEDVRKLVSQMNKYSSMKGEERKELALKIENYWKTQGVKASSKKASSAASTDEGILAQVRDMNYRSSQADLICRQYRIDTVFGYAAILDISVNFGLPSAIAFAKCLAEYKDKDDFIKLEHMTAKYPGLDRTKKIIKYAGGKDLGCPKLTRRDIMIEKRITPEMVIEDLRTQGYVFIEDDVRVILIDAFAIKPPFEYMKVEETEKLF
jgi:hypothetical protein